MKGISLILVLVILAIACNYQKKNSNIQPSNSVELAPPDDAYLLDKMGIPTEQFMQLREYEINTYKKQKFNTRNTPSTIPGQWTTQGPGNLGGRVNTIAVNPKNENIIFIGFSHGGVYRTMDGGINWTSIFDNELSLYISDIAIDPKDTRIIYVATGDHSGGFYCGQGNGIYKSTNNGNTWKHMGLAETRVLSEIIIDYNNPDIIYASSLGYSYEKNEHRGLYKSMDGGENWNKILYTNDSSGITDIAIHPSNPDIIFAVSWNKLGTNNRSLTIGPDGQIHKSSDGGLNWKVLKNGLPSDSINGRIAIEISKSHPEILYARYVRTYRCNGQLSNHLYGIFKSEDTGESWSELPALQSGSGLECDCLGGFGWYFRSMAVNPIDPLDIYILGIEMFRSRDGGLTWVLAVPDWSSYEVHADKHDLSFLSNGDFLLGTDGGLYKHIERSDTWEDMENIPTNQIYRVAYNPNEPSFYYGGLQDNGSTGGNEFIIDKWERIYGGDGFQMAFKQDDPLIYYAEYQNGVIQQYNNGSWRRFTNGLGGSKNWDFPYMVSKHNSSKLLAGSTQVYYNEHDSVASWKSISPNLAGSPRYPSRSNPTITSIDESVLDSNVIIAGTLNGNVWSTREFNQNWKNISSNLPSAYISSVKTSNSNSNSFYATLSGHRGNDFQSYVFRTIDDGNTWIDIHGDLPDLPVYDLLVFPDRSDSVLFIGNHIGVYVTLDAGQHWKRVGENMPFIEVFDLEFNAFKQTIIAATFGKSIMSFPLDNIFNEVVSTKNDKSIIDIHLFPNPASKEIRLVGLPENNGVKDIRILNVQGIQIANYPALANTDTGINIENIPNGLYFLQFKYETRLRTISFIKQK